MSNYSYFKRRVYGPRCSSPPTFICYEMPQPEPCSRSSSSDDEGSDDDDCDDSGSESASNHDEDRPKSEESPAVPVEAMQVDSAVAAVDDSGDKTPAQQSEVIVVTPIDPQDIPCPPSGSEEENSDESEKLRAEKREGKKKEVVVDADGDIRPEVQEKETPSKKIKKKRATRRHVEDYEPVYRPILTIRASQGFVWNQDILVPSYIKDRYIASSPPSSFTPMGSSSPSSKSQLANNNFFSTSNEMDYEVECVEIHIDDGELDSLVPRV